MIQRRAFIFIFCLLLADFAAADVQTWRYRVVDSFPHARNVFTQGLIYHNDQLYESAGHYGRSRLLVRTLENVKPIRERKLSRDLFAEGITLFNGRIYQLTWRSGQGLIYDEQTLQQVGTFPLVGEGWGITHNGSQLIISDGSHLLQFIDPVSFQPVKQLAVNLDGKPVNNLNELEWVDGLIYANIWQSNWIIMIDPRSGNVVGKVRLHDLLPDRLRTASTDVLNGIAYDEQRKRLLVTGKHWPALYHIELIR